MNVSAFSHVSGWAVRLICVGICLALSGCWGNPTVIWSAESPSPDGQWIAAAHTNEFSGPGNAGLYTIVDLKRTRGPKNPIQILEFDFQTVGPKEATVKLDWMGPTHLLVSYESANIDFQAIKCAGVDISIRDLSPTKAQ
jgi:hypothetical protein